MSETRMDDSMVTEEKSEDDSPLETTHLGIAIDNMMMHWCQLLTNISTKPPVPPPCTLDHVKETAEVWTKNFRDAAIDATNEFYRLGIQWELENFEKQYEIEEKSLDAALERQEKLMTTVSEFLKKRTNEFYKRFPNAGKYFHS